MQARIRRGAKRAFTLVEILIVVVILGILAAIVIPQFTDASQEATASSLESMLQTIRSQTELYRVKNQGALPDYVNTGWDDLVNGDYLQAAPVNPYTGSSTIAAAEAEDVGWVWDGDDMFASGYDELTGTFTQW
ncbi:MAG: competence type IV pilus major pilin ComGC [Phycisphaerales bacterium]